jgi:1-acyl-sn-glycerol-3-phosphate acyltransferase
MPNGDDDAGASGGLEAPATNGRLLNALRGITYWWIIRWLRWQFHFRVDGAEVFRTTTQFVLISNHASHLDAVCLLAALPSALRNRCFSAAASDYFYTNRFKEFAARLFANTFPFQRLSDPKRSLEACVRILERGDSLIFFPEGTRSVTGELQPFKKGIGALVEGRPYPVIPAFLQGAHAALGKGKVRPRFVEIRLRFGAPQVFASVPADDASAQMIADRLHGAVQALGKEQ